jgi:hypothetical protein
MTRSAHALFPITAVLVVASLRAATPVAGAAPSAARVLTTSIPAATLTHLDLTALDGQVDLTASPDPASTTIMVTVALNPPRVHNFRRPASADLTRVAIAADVAGNIARLGLTNAQPGNIEATWTISVPARFSARVSSHNGAVAISGLEGGVDAAVDAGLGGRGGRLSVDIPRGRLTLTVGVGTLTARRRSASFDRADVSATVGDAELFLLGHEIKAPHAPGPGHHVTLDGDGPDVIRARVSVGDVTLHIG